MDWRTNGKRKRKSINTRDWDIAQQWAREQEANHLLGEAVEPEIIAVACDKYLADASKRALSEGTLRKYRLLFRKLNRFCEEHGIVLLSQLSTDHLRKFFRNTWKLSPRTATNELARLKTFLSFCADSRWIKSNPAKTLKAPKVTKLAVVPFSEEEITELLAACDTFPFYGARLKVLTRLLLSTGLRIGDAVTLTRDKIISDKRGHSIKLRTAKSGVVVQCPIPDDLARDIARLSGIHPFWTGASDAEDCADLWRKRFVNLFSAVGITGHPHQFRHSFATRLLLSGESIETLSILLGHQDIATTQKHYMAWTDARQERINAAVRNSWARIGHADEKNA